MKKFWIRSRIAVLLAVPAGLKAQIGPPRVLVYSDNPVVSKGLKNQGTYSTGRPYLRNDVVMAAGVWYISAVDGNLGNAPATSPAQWMGFSVTGGAMGPQGAQGLQGLQGIAGVAGTQGPQGLTGLTGPVGAQGVQGLPGLAGSAGAAGPQGLTGLQGPQGLQGATGVAGPAGSAGAQGAAGAAGAAGVAGTQGPTGPTGVAGQQGAPGVPGSGSNPGSSMADLAATNGHDGIANLVTSPCAAGTGTATTACDLMISPAYAPTEYSRFFTPAKDENSDLYAQMPFQGGIGRPRFGEDHRLANRYYESINSYPLTFSDIEDRTPFVFESRISNAYSYADNTGVAMFRGRYSGGTGNYIPGGKKNFLGLGIDLFERGGGQGGGTESITVVHTASGDGVVRVVQQDTNGCSETEDECNENERSFNETMTSRWGGTLKAAPTVDAAGFGNYALDANITGGYDPRYAGERVFLVNLQSPYTAGNVTGIFGSSYPGFARITGDAAANWAAQFGISAITNLVSPLDARTYNASCPSTVTNAANQEPSPFITDENGIGGLPGFCATVGTTSGITAGMACTLADGHSNIEMVKVVSIADGTHLRINAQNYHNPGSYLSCGGAQGYGISMVADDIAPGGLFGYHTQPTTTLHKYFPILGSLGDGSLLVYTNEAKVNDFSTKAYETTTPQLAAVLGSPAVTTSGTSVTAVNLSDPGNYVEMLSGAYSPRTAQTILAVPTLSWTGCTVNPVTTLSYVYGTPHAYGQNLQITVVSGGNCTSPVPTLSTTWANPYRIAPLVVTKKVIDPSNGSVTDGHLLVGNLKPTNWHAGDLVEIPGWIHDFNYNKIVHGKYYTGASNSNGTNMVEQFNGDWAGPDVQIGFNNNTDGHHYGATPTQPIGPGIAYENPPSGYAAYGNLSIVFPIGYAPATAVVDIGCTEFGDISTWPYHPCIDNKAIPYNLFQMHSTSGENYHLGYDPTHGDGRLTWDGTYLNPKLASNAASCSAYSGGTLNYVAGGAGVKDIVQVCAKDSTNAYAWRTIY